MQKKVEWKLIAAISVGFLLIVAGVAVRPIMYVAFAYSILMICLTKPENTCYLMFAWLGICPIFKLYAGGTSLYTYLELIYIVRMLISCRRIGSKFLISWVVMVAYIIPGTGSDITSGIKIIIIPLMFYLLGQSINSDNIDKVTLSYASGVIFGSIVSLLRDRIPNMLEYVSYKSTAMKYSDSVGFTRITRFSGLWGDPNYYSIHLILCIILCAVLFSKKRINNVLFYSIYAFTAIMGAMTGSKSFFLMLVVVTGFVIFILAKDRQYFHLSIFSIAIIIGAVFVFSGRISVFSFVLERLLSPSTEGSSDLSTGRLSIWSSYLNFWWENPLRFLFGTGIESGFMFRVPHNTYIDFPAIFGILGTFVFWTPIVYCSKTIWEKKRQGTIYPLIVIMIMIFFLSMLFNMEFVFELVLAVAFCKISIDTVNIKTNEQYE